MIEGCGNGDGLLSTSRRHLVCEPVVPLGWREVCTHLLTSITSKNLLGDLSESLWYIPSYVYGYTIIILYSYVHTLDTNAMQAMWLFNYKPPWAGMKSTFNLHCCIVTWGKHLISFITQPLDYISQLNILIIMSSPTIKPTILHWTFSVALVWTWPTWPHKINGKYTAIHVTTYTNTKHRTDEQCTAQHKLPVNRVGTCVCGELKEERPDRSAAVVHTAMGLIEEGVVVWQERVADAKDFTTYSSHWLPAIRFLQRGN